MKDKESQLLGVQRFAKEGQIYVLDYSIVTSEKAYPAAGICTDDMAAETIGEFEELAAKIGPPKIVLIMDLPVEEQIRRIRKRSRSDEIGVSTSFLEELRSITLDEVATLPDEVKTIQLDPSVDYRKDRQARDLVNTIHEVLGIGSKSLAK